MGGETFFWLIILFVAQIILGEIFRPKVQDSAKAATLKDFNIPTADETRSVPVVWGTALIDGPNVIWYGDLKSVKLTKKVKSGLFSSTRLTLAFRYSLGMQIALCHGPVDALLQVRTNEKVAFTGNVTGGTGDDGEDFVVDARTIFGGDSDEQLESGGTGGLYAACTLYKGTGTQNADDYLETLLGTSIPGHRGTSYVMWKGPSSGNLVYNYDLSNPTIAFTREPFLSGYVGTNPQMNPLGFVIKRLPNILSGSSDTYYNINDGDANPADVLAELITNDEWGMGLSTALVNVSSFKAAQITLFNEGLGFSGIWDSPRQISEVIDEILGLIDGVIYVDLSTGLITLKLARDDYDPENVLTLDEDSVIEITDFSRGSWDETTNEVLVTYIDRFQKFKEKSAIAQDLANARIQGGIISAKTSYVGISNQAIASNIAFRDLRVLSIPLAKCVIKLNRKGIVLRPGTVFKLNWPDYDISSLILRCTRVGYGELENGIIEVSAVQDVFSLTDSTYGPADVSGWVDPVGGAAVPTNFTTIEAPYFYSASNIKSMVFAAQPDSAQRAFNTYVSVGNPSGTYAQVDSGDSFTPTGTLNHSYSAITADLDTTNTLTVVPTAPDNLLFLQNFTSDYVKTGENLFLITDGVKQEICAFESVTQSSGNYVLHNIYRGLLDTVPQSWSSGARLWFFSYGNSLPNQTYNEGTIYTKLESVATREKSALTSSQALSLVKRATKPYPPGYFRINSSTSTVNISSGSNIVIDWEHRNRISQGETITRQFATGISTEARVEYYLKFYGETNNLLRTVGPLTTLTYTYSNANQVTDNGGTEPKIVTVQLFSKRDGLFSMFPQQRTLIRPSGTAPSAPSYTPGTDSHTPPPDGDATSINGIPFCTNTPANGDVWTYDSTAGCWKPATLSVTLAGDVTGPSSANTVVKIQNRDVSPATPTATSFLGWNSSTNKWEPKNISTGSSGSVAVTSSSTTSETHTANNTWEDVGDLTLAYTPVEISNLYVTSTIEVTGISSNNEHISFRFVLDGASNSEVFTYSKDSFPANNEKHLINLHTVFENVTANTSHSVKLQWHDDGSSLDVTLLNRRITLITCKSPFDTSFSPSLLSGLQYWFDAGQLTGLSNNDPVPQMTDFSGNARHFVAGTSPDTKGQYKTNQVNGLPSLRFTHDGNATTQTNTTYTGPNFLTSYTEGEVFVVIKAAADPATSNLKGSYALFGTDINVAHYPFTDGTIYDDFGSNVRKNTGNPATNLASWNLYNISTKANSWVNRINGTQFYSTTSNTVAWSTAPQFGGNANTDGDSGFDGDIAEVIFYNRVLNSSERSNVRNYISAKYGV